MATYLQLFLAFAKIGAFTLGGGYAMLPLIQNEIIKKGWIPEEDFPDIVALSQSAPGLLAVNISIFIGYRLKGIKGSIIATAGSILPPFLIILIIAMAAADFKDNPTVMKIFQGIRPVVVSLIAIPMLQMARKANTKWWMWLVSAAALISVAFLNISPIYILIVTIVTAYAVAKLRERR